MNQHNDGTIRLKGRTYTLVSKRIRDFRAAHSIDNGWSIVTEIVTINAEVAVVQARIEDPNGKVVAQDYAEEFRSDRGVNSTSALENCCTSAIGRALAAAGLGGDGQYASADELVNALRQQGERRAAEVRPIGPRHHPSWPRERARFAAELERRSLGLEAVEEYTSEKGWGTPSAWNNPARRRFIEQLDAGAFADLTETSATDEPR